MQLVPICRRCSLHPIANGLLKQFSRTLLSKCTCAVQLQPSATSSTVMSVAHVRKPLKGVAICVVVALVVVVAEDVGEVDNVLVRVAVMLVVRVVVVVWLVVWLVVVVGDDVGLDVRELARLVVMVVVKVVNGVVVEEVDVVKVGGVRSASCRRGASCWAW